MVRVRAIATLLALVPIAPAAAAQPVDPYGQPTRRAPSPPAAPRANGPTPAPTPLPSAPAAPGPAPIAPQDPYAAPPAAPVAPVSEPMLAERVAEALVDRAQALLDAGALLDAKQLAVEALVQSPRGTASDRARAILRAVNQRLGIPDAARPEPIAPGAPAGPARPGEDIDASPLHDPTQAAGPIGPPPEPGPGSGRLAASVHGGLYAGLIGTAIGAFLSDDTPAAGAIPVGLVAGLAGGLALPTLVDKLHWTEPQVRMVGSATVWGGVVGGLIGDIAKTEGTTAREVLVSAAIGSTLAGLGAAAYARSSELTRGDIALVDTLAGIGAVGGLTLGMVMQPAETEAYSLNAVLGIATGAVVGVVAGPRTNTTPRRMLRVAGLSALGAAAPFLLYAAIRDPQSAVDERITGLLSTGGLVAGAYLGFRWTRGMDEGLDSLTGKPRKVSDEDAPIALLGRSSAGRWELGGLGVSPLARALAPQPGMALQLLGAAF
jgi:hypothetical protein